MATEGKTKAPTVDGKRLAQLEASVSSLALALTANGFELPENGDPLVGAITIIKRWRELTVQRAELILAVAIAVGVEPETVTDPFAAAAAALESMKERIIGNEARIKELEAEILATVPLLETSNEDLRKKVLELETEKGELQQDVEDLANAKNELANRLAAEGKPSGRELPPEPEPEPEPEAPRERPENARDVGPTFGRVAPSELQTAIECGAEFELAFSNGEFEIIDFPPVPVRASDLVRVDNTRVRLKDGVEINGSNVLERIHGAGLLFEGEQVAYHAFDPPMLVHPRQHWKLAPIFG